jgi:hypothetical protein
VLGSSTQREMTHRVLPQTEIVYVIVVTFAIKLITRAYDGVASSYEAIAKRISRVIIAISAAFYRACDSKTPSSCLLAARELRKRNLSGHYVGATTSISVATFLNNESAFVAEGNAIRATWRVRGRSRGFRMQTAPIHHERFCRRIAKYATCRHRANASGRNLHKRVATFSVTVERKITRRVSSRKRPGAIFLTEECSWRSRK